MSRKPILLRLPEPLVEAVDVWAKREDVPNRHEALIQLIERGLGGDPAPSHVAPVPHVPPSLSNGRGKTVVAPPRRSVNLGRAIGFDPVTDEPVYAFQGALATPGSRLKKGK